MYIHVHSRYTTVSTDPKKSKLSKSPCVPPPCGTDNSIRDTSEASRKLILISESSNEVGGREGKAEGSQEGGQEGGKEGGKEGKKEGGKDGEKEEEKEKIATLSSQEPVEADEKVSEVRKVMSVNDGAPTTHACPEAVESTASISPDQRKEDPDCSPSREPKFEPLLESSSRLSPLHCASLSPPNPPAVEGGVCEGGGGEEEVIVSAVMSEEEEGPLDSSMEDLPCSPPLALAPLISTAEAEGKQIFMCTCTYNVYMYKMYNVYTL